MTIDRDTITLTQPAFVNHRLRQRGETLRVPDEISRDQADTLTRTGKTERAARGYPGTAGARVDVST